MGNYGIKQWRLAVQQPCRNIPCFSTCCKGENNAQIVSDDGEDLEPGVLRSKQSSKLRWKRNGIQGRKSSIPKNNTKESGKWLSKQFTYTMHQPVRYHFKINRVIAKGIDLADLGSVQKYNDSFRYLHTCIDVFSKYAWASHSKMKFFTTNSEKKASIVERFYRTLKTKMWKYFTAKNTIHYLDVLPELVSSYNSIYCSCIKMAPNQVSLPNVGLVRRNLYGNVKSNVKFKFYVGDRVRITKSRRTFLKGYLSNLTGQKRSSLYAKESPKNLQPTS